MWDASEFDPDVYLVRLDADGDVSTMKIILLRGSGHSKSATQIFEIPTLN